MNEKKNTQATVGESVGFERIRRITGYLVGTTDRFNNAKRAEERDRVKHSLSYRASDRRDHPGFYCGWSRHPLCDLYTGMSPSLSWLP